VPAAVAARPQGQQHRQQQGTQKKNPAEIVAHRADLAAVWGGNRLNEFIIWAHRGASAHAPENTMAAFALAELQGAHGVELDLQITSDGVPVVLHDETLQRTTDGRGRS